jgi:hypothetical protein
MTNTFLISENVLRTYTDINANTDTDLIKNAIRESQDILLQSTIGTNLYNKIISLIDDGTMSDSANTNYKYLLDNYIQDFLIYAAYWYALDAIYLRSRNNGLLQPSGGENSDSVDRTLYNQKRQVVQNKMEYYNDMLTKYLIEEQTLFPELNNSDKLYETRPDYGTKYGMPFAFRGATRNAAMANAYGIPVYDSNYPQFPQPYFGYGKTSNKPK